MPLLPSLAGIPGRITVEDPSGETTTAAKILLMGEVLDPATILDHETTGQFLGHGVWRWFEKLSTLGIDDGVEVLIDRTGDEKRIRVSLINTWCRAWKIGPWLRALAARNQAAASTALHLIQKYLWELVYSVDRAEGWLEMMESHNDPDDAEETEGDKDPDAQAVLEPEKAWIEDISLRKVAPESEAVKGHRNAISLLKSVLPSEEATAFEAMVKAARMAALAWRRLRRADPHFNDIFSDIDASHPLAMYFVHDTDNDAIVAALDEEHQGGEYGDAPFCAACLSPSNPLLNAHAIDVLRTAAQTLAAAQRLQRLTHKS